ncbi:EAL domain-containing protein [Bradyrhizobium sp. U87765 SZCCT0131]|uniref:EAL domain-containing protein n=1 Tax=unclassified Bradyrhizobium TaxID=2631580 RepID=UPI001BA5623D|nr:MULTISPECIES: EAL domain-containing protein [unclassified Bradyrhizobium]MBR1218869.1 EAL domain-containing protein [Bradyrhizobium sp. U87765 SZCCT0131]MBR1261520.1 EAL domain-containing protein [Bradyrhizobium sp. U87765 SZCCT0134]MBR1306627.1 EAL domain-containing protein [Bradyrhizobium sp. U87765 SZCCT0110]MBR1317302.1 EAL domain-containing protein [Bradyrhizobium sp. U87765 SZCCT0109]MBR1351004.1 EAL domain-containing protein [Bradyrhizobium sp. U87765 SZCCT0048]
MNPSVDQKAADSTAARLAGGWLPRLLASVSTIRNQILIAFLAMCIVTAVMGTYATLGIRHAGELVAKTFDESLMSINYARAAAADFSAMRAAFARSLATEDPAARKALNDEITSLARTLTEDLSIAAERSQSARAAAAARKAQDAATAWEKLHLKALGNAGPSDGAPVLISDVDQYSRIVDQEVELLVNYTAGDGFLFRQRALAAIDKELRLNIAGLATALLLSALIAWLLARRIIRPVAVASAAARGIAGGDLETRIPSGGNDELGMLLRAMGVMRDNIRAMMEREIAQRRSAQARLADALENSREGVVMLDADGRIALANAQACQFIDDAPQLLHPELLSPEDATSPADGPVAAATTREARLPDGRWLRVSRSHTQEGGSIIVYGDISALKEQEAQLHATNLRLDAALENMSQGLCLYDRDARLQVVNRRFCEIFCIPFARVRPGMSFAEVLGLSVAAGNHSDQTAEDLLAEHQRSAAHDKASYFLQLSDERIVEVNNRPTADGGWLITYEDVTEQRKAESQIAFMARHDALTKLPNRSMLAERIEQAIAQAGRGSNFAVFCLDLDNFKQVNDTLGHPVGDELLCAVADRLRACVREVDTVARLGGDEFAIIQSGIETPEDAARLARRIVECVAEPYEFGDQRIVIGCSVGISLAPGDGTYGEKLLKNADVALYRAKTDGRGTWRFFEPEMDAILQERRALELDLREAMERDQFDLFYQPLYDLSLNEICGFEALLRWRHPTRGLVPPDQFVPIAEEIGLIIPLGEWALRRACDEAAGWPNELKVAVNISAVQFRSPRLIDAVAEALALSRLPARRLELEITESVLLANSVETLATLHKLRGLGPRIALDDFGTGYSSLSYLRSFPFDKLKIDRSFVKDATTTDGSDLIVRAIISLGKSLGMRTTAEGVETLEQLNRMRAEGCSEAQGFLFSPPVPAGELPALLSAWRSALRPGARAMPLIKVS